MSFNYQDSCPTTMNDAAPAPIEPLTAKLSELHDVLMETKEVLSVLNGKMFGTEDTKGDPAPVDTIDDGVREDVRLARIILGIAMELKARIGV